MDVFEKSDLLGKHCYNNKKGEFTVLFFCISCRRREKHARAFARRLLVSRLIKNVHKQLLFY